MLNTRLSVAIHILALVHSDPTKSSEKIAESVNTNPVVIRRISSSLKTAGILTSKSGVSGYKLSKEPSKITLYDVYHAVELENELFPVHNHPNPNCPIGKKIQLTLDTTFESVNIALKNELTAKTLADVLLTMNQIK